LQRWLKDSGIAAAQNPEYARSKPSRRERNFFAMRSAALIMLSLNIAGAYCRSMSTTSIPGRLLRSNFRPVSIAAATSASS
jgi:hypothetical protein